MSKRFRKAERLKEVKPSGIRRLFTVAQRVPGIISLGIGEPDFNPPPHVIEAASQAMKEGKTHYAPNAGIPELREALAEKAKCDYGLSYDPESEVLVTAGATEAVFLALMAQVNPGDEVLVPNPGFLCYGPAVWLAGGVPVPIPLYEREGFKFNAKTVMSQVTDKSRAIIINSPHNPTGSVTSYDDLKRLAELAVERDLVVISDEVYEKITYDNVQHYCLASFPGMWGRTLVVNSFSKTYAMTGFRVGHVLGPKELIESMMLVHQHMVACVGTPAQYATLAALQGSQDCVKRMVNEFDRRRRFIYSKLNQIEGFRCALPKGAFYVFPNIKNFEMSSVKFSEYLVNEAKVATVPGSSFGKYGEGYLRLSYATNYEKIKEALDRIEKAVNKLK
ncbi:MAG: pyridoxal phosphate-dependent aminotransferase [Thermoproteota archaeon]|nr:pyridoxal phosphate-dependent aminotransferase [Thermoproteota archaeon]